MGYTIKTIDGELKEYAFDFGGVIALRNFTARTNGNRLIIQSTENANFSILDALVNEVEIDGVVYDDVVSAQEALQRLVFNPAIPVLLTKKEKEIINKFDNWIGKGLCDGETISLPANTPKKITLPNRSLLYAIELKGKATVKIGTSSFRSDLGEITGNTGAVLQLGLLSANEIWLLGDVSVEVVPIIYRR